jgi:hypothetical protein
MSYFPEIALVDSYGFGVENTPMDEMRTITPVRLVGANFSGTTIDTNFWISTVANNATIVSGSNAVFLTTGTTANGTAILQSNRTARYVGGCSNRFRAQVILSDSGSVNNVRRWGAFNATDGCFFEVNGTAINVVTRRAGVDLPVASAEWNGTAGVPTLTNLTVYEMYWTNSKVYFVIGDRICHTVSTGSMPWSDDNSLPVRLQNTNSAGITGNVTLECKVATIYRMGALSTETIYKNIATAATTLCKIGAGRLQNVVINTPVSGAITIYDGIAVSGSIIAIINPTNSPAPVSLAYGCPFFTGLTVVTAQSSVNVTIIYE